jgi:hypothetical protein
VYVTCVTMLILELDSIVQFSRYMHQLLSSSFLNVISASACTATVSSLYYCRMKITICAFVYSFKRTRYSYASIHTLQYNPLTAACTQTLAIH